MNIDNVVTAVNARGDHAVVGSGLILAGFVPISLFTSENLQILYFALLIPPAAYHCYLWGRKAVYPMLKKLYERYSR